MSLWSMDPDRFAATDFQMEQAEKREEWPKLHGDGGVSLWKAAPARTGWAGDQAQQGFDSLPHPITSTNKGDRTR